jgi:hypothetical protein
MIIYKRELQNPQPSFLEWVRVPLETDVNYENSVVIVMDTWNDASNYDSKIPFLNEFLSEMREHGSIICFSPYGSENHYRSHPCRTRVVQSMLLNRVSMPPYIRIKNVQRPTPVPHLQGKTSDRWTTIFGSKIQINGGEVIDFTIHPSIHIHEESDIMAWEIRDVLSYFSSLNRPLEHVFFVGKHLNWCILNRPLGMEEWKRYGFNSLIVKKDCVTCTNDPRSPPYCSQDEMDELHFRYVESFWGYTL